MNGTVIEELSTIVHREKALKTGKKLCTKLLETIPRQLFEIAIQATIGSKVLARETIKPYRKDVTAKLVNNCVHTYTNILLYEVSMIVVKNNHFLFFSVIIILVWR